MAEAPDTTSSTPRQRAWRRFRQNRWAIAGTLYLGLVIVVCGIGYPILPDSSPQANRQLRELARKPPGTSATALLIPKSPEPAHGSFWSGYNASHTPIPLAGPASYTTWEDTLFFTRLGGLDEYRLLPEVLFPLDEAHPITLNNRQLFGKPYKLVGDSVYYVDATKGPQAGYLGDMVQQLNEEGTSSLYFPLGTDAAGRDLLSRLILGGRISLGVGLLAVIISLVVGVTVGLVAGYYGGWVDSALQWLMTVIWSLPSLLLAIAIAFALGRGFGTLCIAIGLSVWVDVARIVRGEVLSLRERTFIQAARVLGLPTRRILFGHILPNLLGPVIILAASNFATAILLEAGLSFLGLGVPPPTPSWGSMMQEGYRYLLLPGGKFLALVPGFAIILLILSLNLVGMGLRDAYDPKGAQ